MGLEIKNREFSEKRIGILQPAYLPWLGFFEQMSRCDIFVFLDDVQYTKNDWRNRNRVKTKEGLQWLTVPIIYKSGQKIKDVRIHNSFPWFKKHLQAMKTWYSKSKFFKNYVEELDDLLKRRWIFLVDLDIDLTQWTMKKLGLTPKLILSSELSINNRDKQLRLIEICNTLNCSYFYEGISGQNYIEVDLFKNHEITVEFQDYHHPYHNQLWLKEQGFISHLSIIDLLFNHGPESLSILTGQQVIPKSEGTEIRHADII